MKHLVSRELHAYWDRLRGARASPERSDIDPGAIRSILADTFIIEIGDGASSADREFAIRLAGTRVNASFGLDLKGRSLLSLWRTKDWDALREVLALVLDEQVPVVVGARDDTQPWAAIEFEMMILPLRHYGKTHRRLLGSIATNQASRFRGLQPVGALGLTSFRRIDASDNPQHGSPAVPVAHRHGRFLVYEGGR